jgi:hypothetical protein
MELPESQITVDNTPKNAENFSSSHVELPESQITLDNNTPKKRSVQFSTNATEQRPRPGMPVKRRKPARLSTASTVRNLSQFQSTLTGSARKGIKTSMGRDADDFKTAEEMMNNIRWQEIAHGLDDFSRVFFPATYAIILAIFFASHG